MKEPAECSKLSILPSLFPKQMSKFEIIEDGSHSPDFFKFSMKQRNKPRGNKVAALTAQDHGIDDLQQITRKSVVKV